MAHNCNVKFLMQIYYYSVLFVFLMSFFLPIPTFHRITVEVKVVSYIPHYHFFSLVNIGTLCEELSSNSSGIRITSTLYPLY